MASNIASLKPFINLTKHFRKKLYVSNFPKLSRDAMKFTNGSFLDRS